MLTERPGSPADELSADYKMIETLTINNFRCFRYVMLENLRRVNIVVGRNASGKTALLESIFLAASAQPESVIRMRGWRLLGNVQELASAWKDLFYGFDDSQIVSISLHGTPKCTQMLRVFYEPDRQLVLSLSPSGEIIDQPFPLTFERTNEQGDVSKIPIKLTADGLKIAAMPSPVKVSYYASALRASTKDAAKRFSTLSKRNEENRMVETLRRVYPFIEGLSLETDGNEYMVYASVTSVKEKVPVSLISEGVYKLMSILLGIIESAGGAVLIDEIENGFYFETLPEIWKLLLEFAEEYKTQLFVSTHSLEAIRDLSPLLETDEGKFSLLRTEKSNGECVVRKFAGVSLRNAIEQRIEVR